MCVCLLKDQCGASSFRAAPAGRLTHLCSHRHGGEQRPSSRDQRLTFSMAKRRTLDVYRAPFPLYAVKVDPTTGLVVTAGGGGASKTGIKNALVSTEEVLRSLGVLGDLRPLTCHHWVRLQHPWSKEGGGVKV